MNLDWETIPIYRTVTSIDEFMEAIDELLLNGYWVMGFDGSGVVMRDSLGHGYNVLVIDIPADDDSEEFDELATWLENVFLSKDDSRHDQRVHANAIGQE